MKRAIRVPTSARAAGIIARGSGQITLHPVVATFRSQDTRQTQVPIATTSTLTRRAYATAPSEAAAVPAQNASNLPASTDLLEVYRGLVAQGRLRWDEEQVRVVMKVYQSSVTCSRAAQAPAGGALGVRATPGPSSTPSLISLV